MKVLSPIERLDLAAWVQSKSRVISYVRAALPIVTSLAIIIAMFSEASARETMLVWGFAVTGVIATILLWIDWRYKVYALVLVCFLIAVGYALSHDHPESHTIFGWIAAHSYVFLYTYWGCAATVLAYRYAKVNGSDWEKERNQVESWLGMLKNERSEDIVGFEWGNFWRGYWTFRILKRTDCLMIAQFKKGTDKLASCCVRELDKVAFTRLPSGKWKIDIIDGNKKKSFKEIDISPQMLAPFEAFVQPASA